MFFYVLSYKHFSFSDILALDKESFTYLYPAKDTTSWLDHIAVSESLKYKVDVKIRYDLAIYDHFPLACNVNIDCMSESLYMILLIHLSLLTWIKYIMTNKLTG